MCDPTPKPLCSVVTRIRFCLKCQKGFESRGNRICPRCTEENLKVSAQGQRGSVGSRRRGFSVSHGEGS